MKVLTGFVPWIVFTVAANRFGPGAVGTACLLALVVAVGLIVRSMLRGETPKLLEVTGAVVFLGLGIVAFAVPTADAALSGYGRALAAFVLAVVIFATLPVMPFTEQYARESVPREYWHTGQFRAINRRISAAWGGVVLAMSISHAAAGLFDQPGAGAGVVHRPVDLIFNWVVPGLLVWAAVRYTGTVSGTAPKEQGAPVHGAHEAMPR
ncbi:hypothetical protein WCD74_26075 [Actinomycetospora sp. OC33-EN08]|uniref:Intracellular septation protein A n=1 Tax=Actinomycetospora aurantiaca TaxID=3129233 RepID=A0ABU8MXU9_9PSEU